MSATKDEIIASIAKLDSVADPLILVLFGVDELVSYLNYLKRKQEADNDS